MVAIVLLLARWSFVLSEIVGVIVAAYIGAVSERDSFHALMPMLLCVTIVAIIWLLLMPELMVIRKSKVDLSKSQRYRRGADDLVGGAVTVFLVCTVAIGVITILGHNKAYDAFQKYA